MVKYSWKNNWTKLVTKVFFFYFLLEGREYRRQQNGCRKMYKENINRNFIKEEMEMANSIKI